MSIDLQRSKFICNRPSLDVYGQKWTKKDKNYKNRRLWTSLDKNGQNWTKIDAVHGRPWTSMVD